ncbi:hypothetical protein C8F01DRAFT_1134707 [Mycena amicta]|nr:hypothetical protein C8F01DRAFT_1134707 [Mycena amicta]
MLTILIGLTMNACRVSLSQARCQRYLVNPCLASNEISACSSVQECLLMGSRHAQGVQGLSNACCGGLYHDEC